MFRKKDLPVAFCLMPNRRTSTYVEVFQRLKKEAFSMGEQFEPKHIRSDFEAALIQVIRQEASFHVFLTYKPLKF